MTQQRKTIYAIALDGHQNHYQTRPKIGHQALDHIFAIWIVFLSGSAVSVDGISVDVLSYPFFPLNLLLKIFREKIRDMKSLEKDK